VVDPLIASYRVKEILRIRNSLTQGLPEEYQRCITAPTPQTVVELTTARWVIDRFREVVNLINVINPREMQESVALLSGVESMGHVTRMVVKRGVVNIGASFDRVNLSEAIGLVSGCQTRFESRQRTLADLLREFGNALRERPEKFHCLGVDPKINCYRFVLAGYDCATLQYASDFSDVRDILRGIGSTTV
jgi:hypothetical protein